MSPIQVTISLLVSNAVVFVCHHATLRRERLRRRLVNYGDEFNQGAKDDTKERMHGILLEI